MKVLIVHQHFKIPQRGGAIRSYYLARAIVDQGFQAEVVTAHDQPYKFENVDGIGVHYLQVPYNNSFGFAQRARSFLKFVWKASRNTKAFQGVDVCYAISVPLTVGLVALWVKRQYKIPFLFEVGDLWPDAPVHMGFISNPLLKKFLYYLERKIYYAAESIVALSPPIKETIEKKAPGKKVHLLPNMADTQFFNKGIKDPGLEVRFKVRDKFVVSYIGALGVANGLDYFLECAQASRKAGLPAHFILCGEGALKEQLKQNIEAWELANVSLFDFTNRDGVLEILRVTDAVFVSYKPVPILETGSPNKFFDGLAAGKLILINFGGWIKKEIEENRYGLYLDPRDSSDFIRKIKSFIDDPVLLESYQFSARTLAEKKYAREKLTQEFIQILENATK